MARYSLPVDKGIAAIFDRRFLLFQQVCRLTGIKF